MVRVLYINTYKSARLQLYHIFFNNFVLLHSYNSLSFLAVKKQFFMVIERLGENVDYAKLAMFSFHGISKFSKPVRVASALVDTCNSTHALHFHLVSSVQNLNRFENFPLSKRVMTLMILVHRNDGEDNE